MAFQEMIETVSFGRTVPKMNSCLGLFISSDHMFLAESSLEEGRTRISHLVRIPIPAEPQAKETKTAGSLNTDFLSDSERIVNLLKKPLSEMAWGSKFVVVTLSQHFGILRYFSMPGIDRRFWKTAVPAEAKKYIPIPFSTLDNDFQLAPLPPGPDKRPRLGVLFGVTPSKNMASIRQSLESLVGVELAPVSVERLWDGLSPSPDPYAQVHFDGGEVRILISELGIPVFYRDVFLGKDAAPSDIRKVDLGGCIDFTRKQLGSKGPSKIRVSGQIPQIDAWRSAFAQEIGLEVAAMDIDKPLGLKTGQWGGYAALGASLRHQTSTRLQLDLSGVARITEEDRRAAWTIFKITGIASLLLLALGGARLVMANLAQTRLSKMLSTTAVLEEFSGKQKEEIETSISRMRDRVNFLASITTRDISLTQLMKIVSETIPDPVWVTNLNFSSPISISDLKAPRTLNLSGNVIGPSPAAEQDLAFRFTESLRKDPVFSKAFLSIEPTIENKTSSPEEESDGGFPDPSAAEANLEKRTHFVIFCSNEVRR
jgi:hypothetical protein